MPLAATSQHDQNTLEILKPPPDLSSFKTFAGAFFGVAGRCLLHPLPSMTKNTLEILKHTPDLSGWPTFAGAFFGAAAKCR